MLALGRSDGDWVEIRHRSGDVIKIRVYNIRGGSRRNGRVNLAFDDPNFHFVITRPEKSAPPEDAPGNA